MIYSEYKVKFYKNSRNEKEPVLDYLLKINIKDRLKIEKYLEYLKESKGYLDEPLSRHITGKIRELKVDFGRNRHRVFYFSFINKNIILLHAFFKKSQKAPRKEIRKALNNYYDFMNNLHKYDL
ncbi:type II toxin-antitoxin system RelE/ParE family toxin [Patescibacteria group bacterium]|nr:type II toxin-antitoxin system RelE/ParE family toxin [Patescibacteria group bacterium]